MKAKEYIIGGIDTDCGKTYVTGILARKLLIEGKNIITSKLIQTGCKGVSEDIVEHRRLMKVELFAEDISKQTCSYIFSYPASPHLAAEIDNTSIDINKIRRNAQLLSNKFEIILCEAAGGLMVPLTKDCLTIDYLKDYNLPLILVASSKLGSINHTLLSFELCLSKQIDLPLIIYNQIPGHDEIIAKDSFSLLSQIIKEKSPKTQVIHIKDLLDNDKPLPEIFND